MQWIGKWSKGSISLRSDAIFWCSVRVAANTLWRGNWPKAKAHTYSSRQAMLERRKSE